jgi:hypothetical protein
MIMKILDAIQAGKQITNPAMWKNAANLTNMIASILSVALIIARLFYGKLPDIPDDMIIGVAGGIATILFSINSLINTITTKKNVSLIGLPKAENDQIPEPDKVEKTNPQWPTKEDK